MTGNLTASIHQYLTSAPSSLFAQQPVEIDAHWEGDANLLWRIRVARRQAVLKLFLDAGQARSRRQFDGQQIFSPLGLAPQPLWVDRYPQGLSRQVVVYTWVGGEAVNPDDPGELESWAEAIGALHTTPFEEVGRFSPHPANLDVYWRIEQGSISRIEQWLAPSALELAPLFRALAEAARREVERAFSWAARAPLTPVHGDLSLAHTLVDRGRIVLLDWEMFGLGDPALDVARLLQREAQTLSAAQVERWLARYLLVVDQSGMEERITLYRQLLDLHNVVYLLVGLQQNFRPNAAGQLDEELRTALPFMQAALSAALARAGSTLNLTTSGSIEQVAEDFFTWLAGSAAAPP